MGLYDKNSRYTPEALEIHEEIEKALNPIFKKWNNKGHCLREISHIVTLAAIGLESMLVLIEAVENRKKKREDIEPECPDGPKSIEKSEVRPLHTTYIS